MDKEHISTKRIDGSRHIYRMTVDLNVLEHLGINLYSNIAAVLTEVVANVWDADAENVEITLDSEEKWIEIVDDGIGMSVEDMNDKYLRVGYRRRHEDPNFGKFTAKGRQVMGRKGLGKLSLFSVANSIEVQTAKEGTAHGMLMSVDDINSAIEDREGCYSPRPLSPDKINTEKGTKIILREIKRQRLERGVTALRKRLARRFSVLGQRYGFHITIDGEELTTEHRGDMPIIQFLWTLGEFHHETSSFPMVLEQEELNGVDESWPEAWRVNGWIGTAERPKQLDSKDAGNLNSFVGFARGRLYRENILDKINDGRIYTKYLTGQIEADFLDVDDSPDIATSDRQRIQEDDERYEKLLEFLRIGLTKIEKRWSEWRKKHETEKAKEQSPALKEWFDRLPSGFRDSAEKMIANLSALPLDKADDRKLLYRHGILAFERMRLRGSTEAFVSNLTEVDKLIEVLADRDALEVALYYDIVISRLEAIRAFTNIVDEDDKEKVLQQYLFDHLWLFDPSWERATSSEFMESRLMQEGVITTELTDKEKLSRVDIAYRTNAGKHIIVEMKRVGRKVKSLDLQEQGQKYVDKLKKILVSQEENHPNIEVVFVVGKPVDEETSDPNRLKNMMASVSPGSRIVHYDSLIEGALNAYSEYLEKAETLNQLDKIVDRI